MERVIAYVDGFNLYFGLRSKGWRRFYWLNVQKLAQQLLLPEQTLVQTRYFTTVVKQPEDKRLHTTSWFFCHCEFPCPRYPNSNRSWRKWSGAYR